MPLDGNVEFPARFPPPVLFALPMWKTCASETHRQSRLHSASTHRTQHNCTALHRRRELAVSWDLHDGVDQFGYSDDHQPQPHEDGLFQLEKWAAKVGHEQERSLSCPKFGMWKKSMSTFLRGLARLGGARFLTSLRGSSP